MKILFCVSWNLTIKGQIFYHFSRKCDVHLESNFLLSHKNNMIFILRCCNKNKTHKSIDCLWRIAPSYEINERKKKTSIIAHIFDIKTYLYFPLCCLIFQYITFFVWNIQNIILTLKYYYTSSITIDIIRKTYWVFQITSVSTSTYVQHQSIAKWFQAPN